MKCSTEQRKYKTMNKKSVNETKNYIDKVDKKTVDIAKVFKSKTKMGNRL